METNMLTSADGRLSSRPPIGSGSVSQKRSQLEAELDNLKRDVKQVRVKLDSTSQDVVKLIRLVSALPDTFEKALARFYGTDHSQMILDAVKVGILLFLSIYSQRSFQTGHHTELL